MIRRTLNVCFYHASMKSNDYVNVGIQQQNMQYTNHAIKVYTVDVDMTANNSHINTLNVRSTCKQFSGHAI